MRHIVITGSTRGIGLGLAEAFLAAECAVTICGRRSETLDEVRLELETRYGKERVHGRVCDVTRYDDVQALWDDAIAHFNKVDVWINNAGVSHPQDVAWEQTVERMHAIVDINILGTMYGARVAVAGMLAQGYGAIYNLEGLGSAGRHVRGTSLYGTTKAAVRYFTDALINETKGTPLVVGAIRPGMVMTKLVTDQLDTESDDWPRARRVFNLLADRVETVTPWIVRRVLANTKTGVRINWLSGRKVFARFLLAPFRKRNVFDA